MIVTATKRVEGLQDVPIAISVMSGAAIEERQLGNLEDLTVYMPNIHVAEGGVFDSAQPQPVLREGGEILLEFITCNAGTVAYDIPSIGRQGLVPIERIALDNVALCYALERAGVAPGR